VGACAENLHAQVSAVVDYTQAMMDLGNGFGTRSQTAMFCFCPLESDCEGRQTPDPNSFPIRKTKKKRQAEKSIQLLVLMNQSGNSYY